MRVLPQLTCIALLFASAAAEALGPSLDKEQIIASARQSLSDVEWAQNAHYDAVRGVGLHLSAWVVVVSCTTCSSGESGGDVIVLGLKRDGAVQCRALIGLTTCADGPPNGGITSQTIEARNSRGDRVQVQEIYQSGGAEHMLVTIKRSTDAHPSH